MDDKMEELTAGRALRIERLGSLIREKRKINQLTLEQVAKETGISAATLSRLERWHHICSTIQEPVQQKALPEPDTRTLAAISSWLGVALDSVLGSTSDALLQRIGESTPDAVTAHLRADRRLSPEATEALSNMFRVAYQQFAATPTTSLVESTETDVTTD